MSLFPEIQSAVSEATEILAQIGGKPASAAGNTLLPGNDTPLTGVYSAPRVAWLPMVGGGYRKRTEVRLKIPRTSLATPPAPNSRLTRTDVAPAIIYNVDHVDTQDAINWVLTLVNFSG